MRKLNIETAGEKYKALRDLESVLCNKVLVPKATISTRTETKKSIFLHWNNLRIKEKN